LEEEKGWLAIKHFDAHYGDTTRKEFYVEVPEKWYEGVAEHYLDETGGRTPSRVLHEVKV